jgi:phage shock protein PspC (stress-responsive transcriptional regulator)
MQVEGFFEWLGEACGAVIRFIVDGLRGLFHLLASAGSNFLEGLSSTLGMDRSLISIIILVLGVLTLFAAIRSFMRGSVIFGLILLFITLWLFSLIIS